ncbi:Ubiquitin-like modifier-activating enzyme 6 [Labeo rohita]|uniref:Ubiquitin-like modifier-activating enzyme 6 n=1 Tax=Labeo rohita TaxID=84645 RepID=A0ABQ8N0I9_LABRO|nr:Ubiquitin-like modifier-activating enzyme 6 [Labeo rohita]
MADSMDIDDSLYSRQRYVLGDSAMQQMAQSNVFLSGMGALGVEIAKNIVLAGVKRCEVWDLGTNFFIREEDVHSQKKRVEAVHSRVAELNPYVQCVVLTETKLSLQKRINNFCHSQQPPIKFIGCDVFGICSRVFCDFGDAFEVLDPTGEEPKELFIQNISQGNPGIVTCMDSRIHGLQTGQSVCFKEINGMIELNGTTHQVTVLSPYSFAIGDTSSFQPYAHGGIFRLVKTSKTFNFEMMEQQLSDPRLLTPDFSKPEVPLQLHTIMLALDAFLEQHARLPNIGCLQDAEVLLKFTEEISRTLKIKVCINQELVKCVSRCARGCLSPLAAAVGGIASQEVLKALTGKFSPLHQWFYLDAVEVVQPLQSLPAEEFAPRWAAVLLAICITDPDLIEKSNLNRQFLFRPHHIRKPKSTTAAAATLEINPEMNIDAHLNKVCPDTEDIYCDAFFSRLNLVVTALDNVEARRYVDSRSVSNQKALLDSGTMGTKGHTEIIVPYLTESYNSHRDPPEEEIPFCTLKSFPAVIEHTIQWARDKFESAFSHKPTLYNVFWQSHSSAQDSMMGGESMDGAFQAIKLLSRRPTHWDHCLTLARLKFDKYFKRKALQLLHSFPLDTRLKDGSLFWQSPKRPPSPIEFDLNDPLHFSFVVSAARLFSEIYNIQYSEEKLSYEAVSSVLAEVEVPEYRPAEKHIETDETIKKPDQLKMTVSSEEEREAIIQLQEAINSNFVTPERLRMTALSFEKDDDSNGHMDFVASASALRAHMYAIEAADRLQTKRIAGKIIPAIATSTAAVAGLVSLELMKVAGGYGFELFKNCFFNLAIPVMVLTETAQVKRTQIREDISFSIWDRWTIFGHEDFTLSDFISAVRKLIKPSAGRKYVDLTVSFAPELDGDEDLPGPPVRYYFSRESESGEKA